MGTIVVVTSPVTLARLLWRYGEDELWERAQLLSPEAVADIGERAGGLIMNPVEADAAWPERPQNSSLLLAAIEALDGALRPAPRRRRRPEKQMPAVLDASERDLWFDPALQAVSKVVDERNRDRPRT